MIQQLKKALGYCEDRAKKIFKQEHENDVKRISVLSKDKFDGVKLVADIVNISKIKGAKQENARLAPLHEALVECVEFVRLCKTIPILDDPEIDEFLDIVRDNARQQLSKLETRLKEMGYVAE